MRAPGLLQPDRTPRPRAPCPRSMCGKLCVGPLTWCFAGFLQRDGRTNLRIRKVAVCGVWPRLATLGRSPESVTDRRVLSGGRVDSSQNPLPLLARGMPPPWCRILPNPPRQSGIPGSNDGGRYEGVGPFEGSGPVQVSKPWGCDVTSGRSPSWFQRSMSRDRRR